ncbi:hypothetical protein [Thiolapillus brandeum]|uniref:Sel1 repeat family protein n=1 Tax=Thiolapillus brandeum TaxID=1076588 RepID=A0A7U6GGC9_9GAMM|nr:hypothetical protein [Thiolapillus brandeum]BAO43157.1 hypothetical protein TBH_C0211 [Thiolapillus brandeum]
MEDTEKKASASATNRLWLILSAVMAVTIIAVFMVPDGKEQAQDIPPPPAPVSREPAAAVEPSVSAQPPEPVSTAAAAMGAGEAARKLLAESPDLDAATLYQHARAFRQEGRTEDAWLLYFKAAREGSAAAAMALAEQADPAYFDARNSLLDAPDLVQAHKWYQQAKRNGSREAEKRLEQLLEQMRKAAADGDRQAQMLLAKWK